MSIKNYCVGRFHNKKDNKDSDLYFIQPYITFRPKGLIFFNADKDCELIKFQCCNEMCIVADGFSIPAWFFQSEYSFEDFKKLMDNPASNVFDQFFQEWLKDNPKVKQHQMFDIPTVSPVNIIQLVIKGDFHSFVIWGSGLQS